MWLDLAIGPVFSLDDIDAAPIRGIVFKLRMGFTYESHYGRILVYSRPSGMVSQKWNPQLQVFVNVCALVLGLADFVDDRVNLLLGKVTEGQPGYLFLLLWRHWTLLW